jgi:hypothetical protein
VGFNGSAEHRSGTVGNVTIGRLSIDQPAVVFLGSGTGHDDEAWSLRIGNAFLKGYVVTIDYRNHRIILDRP